MILKYKVPPPYRIMFSGKRTIYCKVINKAETAGKKVYLVKMINCQNLTNVFGDEELSKLNLLDRIKILWHKL